LRRVLVRKPIFLYLTKLNSRMKLYLSEKLIDEKQLYSLGIKLATQSMIEEEVKLGMLILGFFENDIVRQIMKTLGSHSELTLYAVEASKNFRNHNEFLFELLQNTCGFGKLVALTLFEPVKPEQKKWLFEQGAINDVVPNLSAIMCLEKTDMVVFYQNLTLIRENFSQLSYLLAYALEYNNIKRFEQSLVLVEKYLQVFSTYAKSFLDLAGVVMIKKSMFSYEPQYDEDIVQENGWSNNKEKQISNICQGIIKQPKWKNIVLQELSRPQEQTSLIVSALEKLKMVPSFMEFIPLLQRDLFDMDLLKYFLIEHPQAYLRDVLTYLHYVLPQKVLSEEPQKIAEDEVGDEYKPDIWLVFLLKALRQARKNEEALFICCLTARFPDVRRETIQALRVFKTEWSAEVIPALEQAYEQEPVKSIRKRLLRLMGRKSKGQEKEQRYLDVSENKVTPSPFDLCILETKIAGTFFRDLLVVEGQVETGDILYLVREPENKYDPKAIMVTTEDGYVLGYVSKADNKMPASLLDDGEKLYAVLLSDNLEQGKPEIKIMLSKKPQQVGKIIQLPSLSDKM
ncbi:MAG: HIRAN domain-containing protein, partial [Clostridia bacterium]|nr:HIRAN domain-containing protein [Clostridia bacterium]